MTKANIRFAFAVFAASIVTSTALAATIVTGNVVGVPATGAPELTTYTLTATSDAGNIIGFNFFDAVDGSVGIFGPLSQRSPFGANTVFNNISEGQYTGAGQDISQDTHFLIDPADGIAVQSSEDDSSLRGAFNFDAVNGAAAGPSLAFAQVVLPNGLSGTFSGFFTVATPTGNILEPVSGVIGFIPEPSTLALAGLGLIGFVSRRRRRRRS